MLRFLADENFNHRIVRGILRRVPAIDIAIVQDVGLGGVSDLEVLEWAADAGRVVLTHDVTTFVSFAYARTEVGLSMPGVVASSDEIAIGLAIEDLILIHTSMDDHGLEGQVLFLPL